MAKTTEVIVSTEAVDSYNDLITRMAATLEEKTRSFTDNLSKAAESAVISGSTHDKLVEFASYASELNAQFTAMANKTKEASRKFVSQVDKDDKYLY